MIEDYADADYMTDEPEKTKMFEIKILATGSKGNAYIIEDGDKSILIDPGISISDLRKRSNFGLSRLDFALLSHEHKDHSRAVKDLLKNGLAVGMSPGTCEALGLTCAGHICRLKSEVEFKADDWKILPFAVHHDAAEPLGFLIGSPSGKKILFATDTCYINYRFPGVTHWMIECNYSEDLLKKNTRLAGDIKNRIRTSHFEFQNLKIFFENQDLSKTEKIYLIHLSDDNSDEKLFQNEIEKITGVPVFLGSFV
jgi:phosphoribosyl 1,2-cyclic phosphodiesterase